MRDVHHNWKWSSLETMCLVMMLLHGIMSASVNGQCAVMPADQRIQNSDSDGSSDDFGASVAIDGSRAIIGAQNKDVPGFGGSIGAAYIFENQSGLWVETAKLQHLDPATGDYFGASVDVSGDYAVIGARFKDDPAGDMGAVYVFQNSGGYWSQIAKLLASDGALSPGEFGASVAIEGTRIVVGAPQADAGYVGSAGQAYVFELQSGAWVETDILSAADADNGDEFGRTVALSGETVVVGAPADYDATAGTQSGSAYVFDQQTGQWTQVTKLLPGDALLASNSRFGVAVALEAAQVIIGADRKDCPQSSSGACGGAYIFENQSGNWVQSASLLPSDIARGDRFGSSVAISGSRVLVGSRDDEDLGKGTGSAYVFEDRAGTWIETVKLTANDLTGVQAGSSVALSGVDAILGAPDGQPTGGLAFAHVVDGVSLTATPCEVSLAIGGIQTIEIDAGSQYAGSPYWLAGSTSGFVPGFGLGSLSVSLNPDAYFNSTLQNPNQPPLGNNVGFLDSNGRATVTFTLTAGTDPTLAGITAHHAYAVYDLYTGAMLFASNPTYVILQP